MLQRIKSKISTAARLLSEQYESRHVYPSTMDQLHALRLRMAAYTPIGRKLNSAEEVSIRLTGIPHPITVRRTTSDFILIVHIFEQGEYAPVTKWSLPEDCTILDLGGNIGISCLYFSQVFPRCRIITVEPDPKNAALLRSNCSHLIDSGRLTVVDGFVGAVDGHAGIDRSLDSWAFRKANGSNSLEQIPCYSVPTIIQQYKIGKIDLLKCDIEGSEQELFDSCDPWVGLCDAIAVETHAPYVLSDFYRDLRRNGWHFGPPLWENSDPIYGKTFVRRQL